MASSKNTTVVVYGDSFANWTPETRKQQAIDNFNGMLARVKPTGFDGVDPSERLSKEVSDALGTPYSVSIERNVCRRAYDITIACLSCRQFHTSDINEDELERDPGFFEGRTDIVVDSILKRRKAAVIDERRSCFCVDKCTPSQILMHWRDNQHTADLYGKGGAYAVLTPAQVAMARRMWSAALRTKQAEAREKERCQVLVDIQDDES